MPQVELVDLEREKARNCAINEGSKTQQGKGDFVAQSTFAMMPVAEMFTNCWTFPVWRFKYIQMAQTLVVKLERGTPLNIDQKLFLTSANNPRALEGNLWRMDKMLG